MKRTLFWFAVVGLLVLAPKADVIAQDDDGSVTLTHEQAGKLLQRYKDALEAQVKAEAEADRLRQHMEICWAGWSGFRNDNAYP